MYSGDNEKYLRKDIHGNEHIAGSTFLEGLNQSDFSDLYNIIYGHNMNNGSMFGSLKKYKDEGFWKKNQYFTVYTESTAYRYQIFSYEDAVVGGNVYKVGYQPGKNTRRLLTRWWKTRILIPESNQSRLTKYWHCQPALIMIAANDSQFMRYV